jgi:hypothetical protein
MRSATATERADVKTRIVGVCIGFRPAHHGDGAALHVTIRAAHGSDEASFFFACHYAFYAEKIIGVLAGAFDRSISSQGWLPVYNRRISGGEIAHISAFSPLPRLASLIP